MKLKPGAIPIVKPARRIAIALREKVKTELERMEAQQVIAKVTVPTDWASHMVVVTKKDKVRICLDPSDLNRVLCREHFPMATLEDIAQRLHGAKVFSTLDARSGFWQIKLDERSSYLCTMSTPYGRYRFLRMPFGISTAPEIFQRSMQQLLGDLPNTAVVMDDILVWGKTREDRDKALTQLLKRCDECGLKLNLEKCFFARKEVRYLGHVLSSEGLKLDPSRVEDILAIEAPQCRKQLKTFLGMINFVSRFIPNLSEATAPLRDLLKEDAAWVWTDSQQKSFEALRNALVNAPVLSFFDPKLPATLSVDASNYGGRCCYY